MTKSRDIANSTSTLDVDGGTIKLDGNYPVGTGNVALGNASLDSGSLSGNYNTAIGNTALTDNTSASSNTAVGYGSQANATTGSSNTAVGTNSLEANTTGANNTAIGTQALDANTTASNNTAVGYQAAYTQSNANAAGVTAIGYQAGYNNDTGPQLFVGREAGYSTTTGESNTAVGAYRPLYSNTTGAYNTAIGRQALFSNTTASNNVAVGYQAGYSNNTGVNNTVIGRDAGYNNQTADGNVFIGEYAGHSTTNSNNTFLGTSSGWQVTSGQKNTILGRYNGNQGGLDIRTSSNNIVLSDGDGNPRMHVDSGGNVGIGRNAETSSKMSVFTGAMQTQMNLGRNTDGSMRTAVGFYSQSQSSTVGSIKMNNSSVQYNISSDHRLKENVVYDWDATTRLKQLKPARFNFIVDADRTVDGFLDHEAQAVVPEAVHGIHNEVDADGVAVMQGIDQSKLVPLLVKTIQELEVRITALEGA